MQGDSKDELVDKVIDRLVGKRNTVSTILGSAGSRMDTTKPNIHDNKAEFLRERDAVAGGIEKFELALKHILPDREDAEQVAMIHRLSAAIDHAASKNQNRMKVEEAYELAIQNIVQTGFYFNTLFVTLRMISHLKERLKELRDQEAEFWSVPNRAPNYYARTIALRLARLYANEKGQFPTFGTSRDGGHPSTEFGRALEEIFEILDIKARVPNAAKWAVRQLTDDDLAPRFNPMMGGILGFQKASKPRIDPNRDIDNIIQSTIKDP